MRRCDAGSGYLLVRVGWGFAETGPAGLVEFGVEFFGACGLHGRSTETIWGDSLPMGICCGVWENGWPMGICQNVWEMRQACGRMGKPRYRMGRWPVCGRPQNRMGDPLKTYGEMRQAWERRRRMGGRQTAWGAKIALKPGIWERWRPAGFACFYEFLAGGGGMAFATVKASHRACCECRGA